MSSFRNLLDVFQLPESVAPGQLSQRTAVVVDVLRATTTITTALANGATAVIPCETVEEAHTATKKNSNAILGGERGGIRIEGFHLGNSPAEYSRQRIEGRTVVFTTTNGTRAIDVCRSAKRVLLGGFVNATALANQVLAMDGDVGIVCAGTDRRPTLEDTLFAGCLCQALIERSGVGLYRIGVAAQAATEMWRAVQRRITLKSGLENILATCQGGKNLVALGLQDDLVEAARMDRYSCVPFLDVPGGRIIG